MTQKSYAILDLEGRIVYRTVGRTRRETRSGFAQQMGARWRYLYADGYRLKRMHPEPIPRHAPADPIPTP